MSINMKQIRELSFKVANTLTEVIEHIDYSQPLAFDVETDGLYGPIVLAQFYQSHWDQALLVRRPDVLQLSFSLKRAHLVCHNTSYEVSTIQTQIGAVLTKPNHKWQPNKWEDTLLLAKVEFFNKDSFALDNCFEYLFGFDIYGSHGLDKKLMHKANWSGNLSDDQLKYGAIDVFYLLDLYDACADHLSEQYYQLDKLATSYAFEFQCNGLPISVERIQNQIEANLAKIAELDVPINVNSWQQVRPYIGEDESDGLALATFALNGNERAGKVQKARKLLKENSFLQKYLDTAVNERIYGKFTFTTKSGRGNCKDQNLQQLPRSTKGCFEAGPGNVLVMSDFAQLELRYICAVSGEPAMAKLFKEGRDMHTYTADMMKVDRIDAKTCNFNLTYGGSAKMLRSIFISQANKLLPLDDVKALKHGWHNLWPTLTQWQETATNDWRAGKPFYTVLGRKMYAKLYTDAMNLPIQGGSADISKLAMHKMMSKVKEHFEPDVVNFINFIHDSFMFECPDDPVVYKPLAKIIAESMQEAWNELVAFTAVPDLPMPVDVLVGYNWGDLEYEIETPIYQLEI
jgi:hypothetical protein